MAEAADFMAVADTMAAEGITGALVSDSVSVVTRPTDMRVRSAIPPGSTTSTATGNTIRVALCLMDIKLNRVAALPAATLFLFGVQ